ncbi:uncharacterized protein LOC128682481 isoform X2 [Plodia interpunctella]|uniref:uncharacterized protein LOC128682481 isoform X2 n=1 Tax=Plodia interpunctella TaxID=58824 RepID=UPI0023678991|nr:uncharacterized protein LOC128682481 isoform X2 [Plodia interpunctella]
MEKWEVQIQGFPEAPEPRVFIKALQMASDVLKTDLADFEMVRLFDTLLQSPVDLLKTVLTHHQEEEWSNAVTESYKLIGSVAKKYQHVLEPYFENIVKLCELAQPALPRRAALRCARALAHATPHAPPHAPRLAAELEAATTCRSELALLIGTICEYHPEVLEHQVPRIWRTYLSFLSSRGLTDKFTSSLLEGASGLLSSFGGSLPVNELWQFYDDIRRLFAKCINVCVSILSHHSSLFKERIAEDAELRAILWSRATQDGVADALIAVYNAVAEVKRDNMMEIIEKEVMPQLCSDNNLSALRVLSQFKGRGFDSLESCVQIQHLEFLLRCGPLERHTADLIIWYISSGLSESLRLSQTAVLFHRNIPPAKVADLAAAILSNQVVREETITFLASECSQTSIDSAEYIPLWQQLFNGNTTALRDYMRYIADVMECWLEDGTDVLPEKLASLLNLTTDVLSLQSADTSTDISSDLSADLLSRCLRRCLASELVSVAAAVLDVGGGMRDDVWPYISVERCRDEKLMCACCLLLLHAPNNYSDNVLKALQIIFSRNDVEDTTLLKAIKKMESLISDKEHNLDDVDINKTISLVIKLRKRSNMADKHARILQRHVIMFLGKYGNKIDVNKNCGWASVVTSKLKDTIYLGLPLLAGDKIKINLQEILKLAIEDEDCEALSQLLKIICVTLDSRRDPALLSTMTVISVALCRADVATDVARHAMTYCNTTAAAHELFSLISSEQSPGVRLMLCSCLPAMSDELTASALGRARAMMGARGATKLAGLDLIDALIPAIEDNHSIITSQLAFVLDDVSKCDLYDAISTFEKAKRLFIEKIALFDDNNVDLLFKMLISNITVGKVEGFSVKTYVVMTEVCVQFTKEIKYDKFDDWTIVDMIFEVEERDLYKTLYVLAVVKKIYNFDSSSCSKIFNNSILDDVYGFTYTEDSNFELEAVLVFIKEYADVLLEHNYEKTIQLLALIMRNISPKQIIDHRESLKSCLSKYKNTLRYFPKILENSFVIWLKNFSIPQIQDIFIEESHYINIKALNIYLDATEFYLHSFMDKLKMWPKYALRKYADGATSAELSFLTDCLTVAVKVTGFDVKRVLLEGKSSGDYVGVKFCAKFMKAFLDSILKKPFVLLNDDMGDCCFILDDVVKYCIKRKCTDNLYSLVLDLVNEIWPVYEAKTNFQQKYQLLYNMSLLPKTLGRESNPLMWAASQFDAPDNRENSARLLVILPGGDAFVDCHAKFGANCLGASLSECPAATLRALYDALAARPSASLLKMACVLADTDEDIEEKWWDKAMDACCASIAQCGDFDACDKLLAFTVGSLSLGACRRLMLPLLRYSTASKCEQFYSRHIKSLLSSLSQEPRDPGAADKYRQCIVERTRALLLLEVAFEKIPLSSLESPQSALYQHMEPRPDTTNYLTWTVCKLCVTLRRKVGREDIQDVFRRYQCAIYSCLCAAICKSKPAVKYYSLLLGPDAWDKIDDPKLTYNIPIIKRRRKTRHCVSVAVTPSPGTSTSTSTSTATGIFLRTLSEHAHKFDLYPREPEQLETLTYWRDDPSVPETSIPHLQTTINALITEAIESRDFLQILDSFLEVYAKYVTVDWSIIETHIKHRTSKCLPVVQKLLKNKIDLPQLVQTFLQIDLKVWLEDVKMAECFGAALSCERERDSAISSFRDMLKRVKQSESYIKLLYYVQLGCQDVCDEANFRQVTDQTRKLPKTLQNKCLHILSIYLSRQPIDYRTPMFETIELSEFLTIDNVEALDLVANGLRLMEDGFKRRVVRQALEYCDHSMERVRKAAFKVAAKAFEELFHHTNQGDGEPSAKRLKRANVALLNIASENDPYILNVVSKVAAGVTSRNDDVHSVVRSVLSKDPRERLVECLALLIVGNIKDLAACAQILDVYFAELRSNEHFLMTKLRDEPLAPISRRGTLLSYRASATRRRPRTTDVKSSVIDVVVSLDSILEELIQFAKRQPLAGAALLLQLRRAGGGRAPPAAVRAPLHVQLARLAPDGFEPGFEEAVRRLTELSSGSDDADLIHCLYEEVLMRKGIEIFELRSAPMPDRDDITMENNSFSIQELTSCFGRLSNWNDLTIQQRVTAIPGLPMLWTDEASFKASLVDFKDSGLTNTWFGRLLSSYRGETRDSARWLSDVTQWPRKQFDESAVAEALSWQLDDEPWNCEISPKDCLVKISARLMIRALHASEREAAYPSRSNELRWCIRASEMGLHRAVLQCCHRNKIGDLQNEEKLSWHHQKLLSLRGMALERNDRNLLREALHTAVDLISNFTEHTTASIDIYKQVFLLRQDLNELTTHDVDNIMKNINTPMDNRILFKSKSVLTSIYELALVHYDKQWSVATQDEVIKNLAFTLYNMRESNLGPNDRQLALLLNRLKGYTAKRITDVDVTNNILKVLEPHTQYDDTTKTHISSVLHTLGRRCSAEFGQHRQLFATIRDVGYCLSGYCELLAKAVAKKELWSETFTKIRNMMENPHVGSDYHLLTAQTTKLYAIADFDLTTQEHKTEVLRSVMISLNLPAKSTLRVSQLCPALAKTELCIGQFLPTCDIVKVEDQVTVITDSLRRPCVVTFVTSLGTRVRYMHKSGESLNLDAGLLRCCPDPQYRVLPTSDDSGLIEFLEDHETLYSMISSVCNLDEISASVQRPSDDELIMTPSPHTFKQLREKVPVDGLRKAMERNSSCVEDFLMKKTNFQNSLATTAIFNWILGLGDRHLQNFLYSVRSGGLVSVDCGAAFSFVSELPPARLTACLLAATNIQVLESRLQTCLAEYRQNAYMFCNFLRVTFDWDRPEIEDKLPHIQALISGRCLSHHVTRDLVQKSNRKYKVSYMKLFDEVFAEFEQKADYSIVEQISCFLVHCTSPRILQVTRSGWTPWV